MNNLTLTQRRILFRLFTAPGIILHEFAHHFACILYRIPVESVSYLSLTGRQAGSVVHHQPRKLSVFVMISLSPLFLNLSTGILLLYYLTAQYSGTGIQALFTISILYWLAFTTIMQSIPSITDIQNIWDHTKSRWIYYPFLFPVGFILAFRKLKSKIGIYKITTTIAITITIAMFSIQQISPQTLIECAQTGQWGCWEPHITITDIIVIVITYAESQLNALLEHHNLL